MSRQLIAFSLVVLGGSSQLACGADAPAPSGGNGAGSAAVGGAAAGGGMAQAGSAAQGNASAGAGGAAGAGATGGAAGAGGAAGGASQAGGAGGMNGGASQGPSLGCGKAVAEDPTKWTTHDIAVTVDAKFAPDYGQRRYFTRPPKNYDPAHPYPVTIWGQGCGQSVAENTPMTLGPAADASIQVQLLAKKGCYSAGPDGDDANSPELPYFDQVLSETLASYCIDTSKVFMGGYSSGGWLSSLLSCTRADVIRGVGWAAAGLQKNHPDCVVPVAAIITRGKSDPGTPLDQTEAARDSLLTRNGCGGTTLPWAPGETSFDTSSCVEYQGCLPGYPVVWCPTPGGHTNTLSDTKLSSFGFWKLWSSL